MISSLVKPSRATQSIFDELNQTNRVREMLIIYDKFGELQLKNEIRSQFIWELWIYNYTQLDKVQIFDKAMVRVELCRNGLFPVK